MSRESRVGAGAAGRRRPPSVAGGVPATRPGFALVTALLVLMLSATVLLEAAVRAEAERRAALNTAVDIRTRAAARGGLAQLLLRLRALQARTLAEGASNPSLTDSWNRLDTLTAAIGEVELPSLARYRVGVVDPEASLPLNFASQNELSTLFVGLGADPGVADANASLIVAARQVVGGFGSPEEVARLEGVQLPVGWREHLTTLGEGRVNLNTAPAVVLRAVPGMTEESVAEILARRDAGRLLHTIYELDGLVTGSAQATLRANFPALAARSAFEPTVLVLQAEGSLPGSIVRTRVTAVVGRAGPSVQLISSVER